MSSSMSMVEARLPPGFRFHPRDEELVLDYLCPKLFGRGSSAGVDMIDVDLNKCEPWELPDAACVGGREWYFFSRHDRKYATGQRTNRATRSGYWKATGKDRAIIGGAGAGTVVGMRKTLVFYRERAPRGTKTEWVMHEFRAEEGSPAVHDRLVDAGHGMLPFLLREDWVLCRVFDKGTTASPRPSSEESSGSLSSDLGMLPAPLLIAPTDATIGRAPMAAITDGYYGHQDTTSLLPAVHHWPAAPLPFKSLRDLLGDMVQSSGGEPKQDWRLDDSYTRQSDMAQTWSPF
uniref:Uncharacterized protein n=1 Tax=Avena sativa TaxID=4498 RepID=A0ACD5V4D3_AVESA